MKKTILYSLILTGFLTLIRGSAFCSDKLNISLDICQFRFNQDTSLVEIYYGLAYQFDTVDTVVQNIELNPSFLLGLTISQNEKIVIKNIWQTEDRSSEFGGQ